MKKMFALLLTLAMVLALAACGGQPAPAQTDGEKTQDSAPAPAPENTKLVVGFAQIGQESGWRDAETNDIQWYAARNTDTMELHFADAQQKREHQIKAIRSFIEMGVDALNDVHFQLRAGEIHALLGENGAGKSTLIKVLTGVEHMDGGAEEFLRLEDAGSGNISGVTLSLKRGGRSAASPDCLAPAAVRLPG